MFWLSHSKVAWPEGILVAVWWLAASDSRILASGSSSTLRLASLTAWFKLPRGRASE